MYYPPETFNYWFIKLKFIKIRVKHALYTNGREKFIMNNDVIVYTTNDCIECTMVKQVLNQEGIVFEVRNVAANPQYQKEVEQYGFLGVPVTVFQDIAVKGFSNELKQLIDTVKTRMIS